MSKTNSIKIIPSRGSAGILAIFAMVLLTIYMAFAFPYGLFHLKQSETTEIKSVILVARAGERIPSPESYFIGEDEPEELRSLGYNQLTNTGKERMYLLGKFLKLRYYHLLLNGNPRLVQAQSSDSDRCLESAQALLAGLNPPKDSWLWSSGELSNWQPKAVHTTPSNSDDLLSAESNCFKMEEEEKLWKNSTRYQQLLNEFRHDLQTLRANTGLEFEDDLEMLMNIEDALKTRRAFRADTPSWYTSAFAARLAHIASVTAESRYSSAQTQRLYVGRLLHEILQNINVKIHAQYHASGSLSWGPASSQDQLQVGGSMRNRVHQVEPNMYIYLTHKSRLTALLNSLQVYTNQPYFGTSLLIELHYDPINETHFLRLFTLSPMSANILPEPLRINPTACQDSAECSPQQFEQNIRHLLLDKLSWNEVCLNRYEPTTSPRPLMPLVDYGTTIAPLDIQQQQQLTTTQTTVTSTTGGQVIESGTTGTTSTTTTAANIEKLDESLIVGPTGNQQSLSIIPSVNTNVNTDGPPQDSATEQTTTNLIPSGRDDIIIDNSINGSQSTKQTTSYDQISTQTGDYQTTESESSSQRQEAV